jgi:hypothetical protein
VFDLDAVPDLLTEGCGHYEQTAPAVCDYLNDLYMRCDNTADSVVLSELIFLRKLAGGPGEGWMHPGHAQNALFHLLDRLGRSTTGLIDH